ncbi:MAG TPA: tetratricopeptide repeat protein [Candidatus Acidoferrales bacterium]
MTSTFVCLVATGLLLFSNPSLRRVNEERGSQQQMTEQSVEARQYLNDGVRAFKDGKIAGAIENFKRAEELDPTLVNAQLYLGTAYSAEFIPGDTSAGNVQTGHLALGVFKELLKEHSDNVSAIDGAGTILYYLSGNPFDTQIMEESKSFHQRHVELRPQDPEPYYWIGVIDWTIAFHGNHEMRHAYNKTASHVLGDREPMVPELAASFEQKYGETVQEGIKNLNQAITLRPEYGDAMAYLNLLYRQKADMETPATARDNDLKAADDLVNKVKAIKAKESVEVPQR